MMTRVWYLLLLFIVSGHSLQAREEPDSLPVVQYSYLKEISVIASPSFFIDSTGKGLKEIESKTFNLSYARFHRLLESKPFKYNFWIRLTVKNNTDSILKPYLYAGNADLIQMYFVSAGHPIIMVKTGNLSGVDKTKSYIEQRAFSLPFIFYPKESGVIFLKINQNTAGYNLVNLQICNKELIYATFSQGYEKSRTSIFFQILFMGFLLCQMLYSFLQWLIIHHKEYLYYFFYLFSLAIYFFSKREAAMGIDFFFSAHPAIALYLDKALITLPYFLYFRFIRYFLDMKQFYPAFNKWFIRTEYFLFSYLIFDLIFSGIN